jgi:hypothetical protein
MNFWQRSQQLPPILARLLAREKFGPPIADEQLASKAGLPVHQVYVISQCTTWAGIDLPTMRHFLVACNVDFENGRQMKRIDVYLSQRPTWTYLRKSPYWKTFYEPLMRRYLASLQPK